MAPPQHVVNDGLEGAPVHFFVVKTVHFVGEDLALLQVSCSVTPSYEHGLQAACRQILSGSVEQKVLAILTIFVRFHRIECSFTEIRKIGLVADHDHVFLHASVVNMLRQRLQAFGYEHILPVGMLPLPYHAGSEHSFEENPADACLVFFLGLLNF